MMKKIMLSMLAIAALAGCSKNDNNGEQNSESPATIVLSAGVPSTAVIPGSKAPVGATATFTAGVAGWEAKDAIAYNVSEKWLSQAVDIAGNASAQSITLSQVQVYNADNAVKTYMKAWYPVGTLTKGVVSFTNADGTVDAMLAGEVVGSKGDRQNKTLSFVHKTTQLKFEVKKGAGLADNTTLEKITIKNAKLPTGFNLSTDAVVYANAAPLSVPGITSGALVIGKTPAGDAAGDAVMIEPVTGNTIKLDIETSKATYTDVTATIDTDPNFAAGTAYTILLTFSQSGVELKTTVAQWQSGTGSGKVE